MVFNHASSYSSPASLLKISRTFEEGSRLRIFAVAVPLRGIHLSQVIHRGCFVASFSSLMYPWPFLAMLLFFFN